MPCKGVQDSLGFWTPRHDFQISSYWIPDHFSLDIGYRIPYSLSCILDSRFHQQKSHFPRLLSSRISDPVNLKGRKNFRQVASIWLRRSGVHFTTNIVSSPPYYQDSKWKMFTSFLQSNPVNTQALREPWNSKVSVNGVSVLSGLNL